MTMAEDVNVKVIKKTQDRLGKYIKKPPLQEKLLKRPPFRFLHDVITNVIKATSLFQGLYTSEELVSDNVKDKESKVKFLQKAIDTIMFVTGDSLSVKPSKIVAGHEAEKTNEFLQCIAKALKLKLNSEEAVQKVLDGQKPTKSLKKSPMKTQNAESPVKQSPTHISESDANLEDQTSPIKAIEEPVKSAKKEKDSSRRSSRRSKDKSSTRTSDKKDKSPLKSKTRDFDRSKEKVKSSRSSKASSRVAKDENEEGNKVDDEVAVGDDKAKVDHGEDGIANGVAEADAVDGLLDEPDEGVNLNDSANSRIPHSAQEQRRLMTPRRPPSAKGPRRRTAHSGKELSPTHDKAQSPQARQQSAAKEPAPPPPTAASIRSERPMSRSLKSARPSSARPAPPKIRQREIIEEPVVRPDSVKPPSNIILHDDHDENEDEAFLVEEAPKATSIDLQDGEDDARKAPDNDDHEEAQGRLVKQLLETKKDLEGGSQRHVDNSLEIEKPLLKSMQSSKQREQVSKEVQSLRSTIQTLTRSANPLGKLMDYLQEDIDSMQKEWKRWNDEYSSNTTSLKQQQTVTENALEPLKSQLTEIEGVISDQQDKIHDMKNKVLQNEDKLHTILNSINSASK